MTALNPDLYLDLIGKPYDAVGGCWGLVVEVARRMGYKVAGDGTDLFDKVDAPEPGDVVMMAVGFDQRDLPHSGVFLGDGKVLHAMSRRASVAATSLGALVRTGSLKGFYRWKDQQVRQEPPPNRLGGVTVVYVPDVTNPMRREVTTFYWSGSRATIGDFAPADANVIVLNRRLMALTTDIRDVPVMANDILVFGRFPGEPGSAAIALGIGIVLSFLATLFLPALPAEQDDGPQSPTFDVRGLFQNTASVGIAQPVVYGEHRVGGNVIQAFQRADENGASVLHLALFVSRGPIEAISGHTADADDLTGTSIPDSIQINGSPAREYGASVSLRMGTSDQEPMPNFLDVVTAIPYSKTLIPAQPFTHTTTDDVDGFDVNLYFPLGLFNINISGGGTVGTRTVSFHIRWRPTGTTTWTAVVFQAAGARRGPMLRTFTKRGLARGRYEVQVERFAAGAGSPPSPPWPETDSDKESRSDLLEINEVSGDALTYPGKALIGIRVLGTDQLSGGNVNVTSIVKGRKVYVWDGVSETTPNFGSEVWSDNPAWCVLDMLLNPHYGMSRNGRLTLNRIGLAELDEWADLCDTLVSDGRGGTAKRATFDYVLDAIQNGWELIYNVGRSHWGRLFVSGSEIRCIADKARSPVAMLSMANCRDVKIAYKGRRSRPNWTEVVYFNEESNYEQDFALRLDDAAVFTNAEPVVQDTIQAIGVTRPFHAYRLAQFRANHHRLSTKSIELTAGVDTLHLTPMDVFIFQHEMMAPGVPVAGWSGRVLASAAGTVSLDQALVVPASTKITVRTSGTGADVLQERTLAAGSYAKGDAIVVTPNWNGGDLPVRGDPFVCGPVASYFDSYQIQTIDRDPLTLDAKIQATLYDADVFDDDPGDVETFTDEWPDHYKVPDDPADLTLWEDAIQGTDGTLHDYVRVEFRKAARWHRAAVYFRVRHTESDPFGEWMLADCCGGEVRRVGPFARNTIVQVSVVPLSPSGASPHPDVGLIRTIVTFGTRRRPNAPAALAMTVTLSSTIFTITPASDARDVGVYEIRQGNTWAGSMLVGRTSGTTLTIPTRVFDTQAFLVKAVSRYGRESFNAATYSTKENLIPTSVYTFDQTQSEDPGWAGTRTDTTVDGSNRLLLDGANLTGTYDISSINGGSVALRVYATALCGLIDVARNGDECGFRGTDPQAQVAANAFYLDGYEIDDMPTGDDLSAIPANGLIAAVLTGLGPIDIRAELSPTLEHDIDAGGTYESFISLERTIGQLDGRLTLNRPHDRYEPAATALRHDIYGWSP